MRFSVHTTGRGPQSGLRFNLAHVSPKHITKIERWRRIGGVAFHQDAVEALGFGNIFGLLCRLCLLKQNIGVLLGRADRKHKLAALIGSALGLFDFKSPASAMEPAGQDLLGAVSARVGDSTAPITVKCQFYLE